MWKDPWLPIDHTRKPITPRGSNLLRYVAELINPATGDWDTQLVRDILWNEDVKVILALPINTERDNVLAWHYDNKGVFSVKSAYKVCKRKILMQQGGLSSSSNAATDDLWKRIWKVEAPNKFKLFLWWAAHNSHPLRSNLEYRGMKIDNWCVVCNEKGEDGGHLFFSNAATRSGFGMNWA